MAITLTAAADYGQTGQYVARITGRDSKFTFRREFIGRKTGKRNERTEAVVDEPGLYETQDVSKKGKDRSYVLVVHTQTGLNDYTVDEEDAMELARALDEGRDIAPIWVRIRAAQLRDKLARHEGQDPEATVVLNRGGGRVRRADLVAGWRAELDRLADPEAGASDPRSAALAEIRRLMAEHGISAEDLR